MFSAAKNSISGAKNSISRSKSLRPEDDDVNKRSCKKKKAKQIID